MKQTLTLTLISAIFLVSCSTQKKLSRQANEFFFEDETLKHSHVGISVHKANENKIVYQYQADKFFMPASNTKIVTTYAAMKYLPDSLPGIRYYENDTALFVIPTGDPTLLHEDYKTHPVIDFLKSTNKNIYITADNWKSNAFGSGWSWDYYQYAYGPERSPMPIYGNYISFEKKLVGGKYELQYNQLPIESINVIPNSQANFAVQRDWKSNHFEVILGKDTARRIDVPFATEGIKTTQKVLSKLLGKQINTIALDKIPSKEYKTVYSQPLDSMLKPLMVRSDNFFAEQALIMVANELTGELADMKGVAALRKTIYSTMPNDFRWADGSGLSRGNHFSPNDFVTMLKDLRATVGIERIKHIFPHGGIGTLRNYYKAIPENLSAKTGTLTGVVALSGFLETKKGNEYVFSFLVNHHRGNADDVRAQIEKFVMHLYNNY